MDILAANDFYGFEPYDILFLDFLCLLMDFFAGMGVGSVSTIHSFVYALWIVTWDRFRITVAQMLL